MATKYQEDTVTFIKDEFKHIREWLSGTETEILERVTGERYTRGRSKSRQGLALGRSVQSTKGRSSKALLRSQDTPYQDLEEPTSLRDIRVGDRVFVFKGQHAGLQGEVTKCTRADTPKSAVQIDGSEWVELGDFYLVK